MISKAKVPELLENALFPYSDDFRVHNRPDKTMPVMLDLNGLEYSCHVSEIHSYQKNNKFRIQVFTNVIREQMRRQRKGMTVSYIGVFPSSEILVAWFPGRVHAFDVSDENRNVPCTLPLNDWDKTKFEELGFSSHKWIEDRGREESLAFAFPLDCLGLFLEYIADLAKHDCETLRDELPKVLRGEWVDNVATGIKRVMVHYWRIRRQAHFRKKVLTAFDGKCCVCGRNLGVVEAAHIVPISEGGSDCLDNGLALCVAHHRLFDSKLLVPAIGKGGTKIELYFNDERARELKRKKMDAGINCVEMAHGRTLRIPRHLVTVGRLANVKSGFDIRVPRKP